MGSPCTLSCRFQFDGCKLLSENAMEHVSSAWKVRCCCMPLSCSLMLSVLYVCVGPASSGPAKLHCAANLRTER